MTTIKDAVDDLVNDRRLSVEEAMDRHFARTFRQRTNGVWDDRGAVLARISELRDGVRHASITVLDELADGDRYAERHVLDLHQHDGERVVLEVYVFARRDADGRFAVIEETSLPLDGR